MTHQWLTHMIHCYVITADKLPLNNRICQSLSSYWLVIWLVLFSQWEFDWRWQTFNFRKCFAFIGRSIWIHNNEQYDTYGLSNRKSAPYLKMFIGISVCLLDTFSLLFIESENTSLILIHSVQFCLNIDIPDDIGINIV